MAESKPLLNPRCAWPFPSDKDRAYNAAKQDWIEAHPDARPSEYDAAMLEIARKVGL